MSFEGTFFRAGVNIITTAVFPVIPLQEQTSWIIYKKLKNWRKWSVKPLVKQPDGFTYVRPRLKRAERIPKLYGVPFVPSWVSWEPPPPTHPPPLAGGKRRGWDWPLPIPSLDLTIVRRGSVTSAAGPGPAGRCRLSWPVGGISVSTSGLGLTEEHINEDGVLGRTLAFFILYPFPTIYEGDNKRVHTCRVSCVNKY